MKRKALFITLTLIFSALLIYALAVNVFMPVFNKNPFPNTIIENTSDDGETKSSKKQSKKVKQEPVDESEVSETTEPKIVESNKKDALQKLFDLKKQEKLLQSRLSLANSDSMYLVLDMIKETAILEMRGVALHECKILDYQIDNSIKKYHNEKLLNWLSVPFTAKSTEATFPQIVFVEKIAPKDTIEAAKAEVVPTAPVQPDVHLVIDFERNLRLVVDQQEEPTPEGKKLIEQIKWKYKKAEIRRSINGLIKLNREPAMPQINIVLPKTDAIIIYRALPVKPKMVLVM